jgi:ABC-type maltose transport system permease subunit
MLPEIGWMIGIYIITRAISFLTRKGDLAEGVLVKVFSAITILVALFVMIDLLSRGSSVPSMR